MQDVSAAIDETIGGACDGDARRSVQGELFERAGPVEGGRVGQGAT